MVSRQSEHVKARRAAALKANLKRRKDQARAKANHSAPSPVAAPVNESAPSQGPKTAAKAE
jgi:hypothetical protein